MRNNALDKQINCLCPTLKFSPPSEHWKFNPFSKLLTNCLRWANSNVFHNLSSEYELNGSILILNEPENKTGSCGIIVNLCLNEWRPIVFISISSINILPVLCSNNRNKPSDKLLFPAPVLPTIPIFSPALISAQILLRTLSNSLLYLTE